MSPSCPQPHCCHGDEYHTESSRGSDLSDIMEEDEEELCSEMQLEGGGRRRPSGTSHNALKVSGQAPAPSVLSFAGAVRPAPEGPHPAPGSPWIWIGFFLTIEFASRNSLSFFLVCPLR